MKEGKGEFGCMGMQSSWLPCRLATLGPTDFSRAVSGFCQVFIVTRALGFALRPTPKIPAVRQKNFWYPGYRLAGLATKLAKCDPVIVATVSTLLAHCQR